VTQTLNKIGKYEVVEVLGRGGMGVVYKAQDPRIGRLVAIKMMTGGFAENPDLLKRFYREAQSTGTLQHPNIVIVYDLGDQDGNPYLVMEFLEGESLEKMIAARRPMPIVRKLDIIVQVCQALNYAHARGIVHRGLRDCAHRRRFNDPYRPGGGHDQLHVAGADQRAGGGRAHGHLLRGSDAVPVADVRAALRRE
jgi:serine/threonine protein kinase